MCIRDSQNTLQLATGDSATWFMIRKSTFGIDKNTDLGFFGETFLVQVYLATYVCIIQMCIRDRLFISGGAAIGTTIVSRKKKYNR